MLEGLLADYPADNPSWPLVGNLNHVIAELDNLIRFENGLEDDEPVIVQS